MNNPEKIKNVVKEKYGSIAKAADDKSSREPVSCCGSEDITDYSVFSDDYSKLDGYVAEADLGLGCGLPTEYAGIKKGDTIVDLGSGAGNDVFIARQLVGEEGKVIGLDFTGEMIEKANSNNAKLGYTNVEFKFGEIETMPIENNSVDVVISNCVLNLVPGKKKAFSEIYRILKPGGHFCVSDIVIKGEMSNELKKSAELYAGCVSGAIDQEEYSNIITETGFEKVEIKKSKVIELPDDILSEYLTGNGIKSYKENVEGIYSITVVGYKRN